MRRRLAPRTGTAFVLERGAVLRIVDPLGEQVADLVAFAAAEPTSWLSSGRSIDYADTIRLTTGHVLYSNDSNPMLTIVHDDVGMHDFLLTPCSRDTFRILYDDPSARPSCFGNLAQHLAPFGIAPDRIPTTFNVFMNVEVAPDGALRIGPPRSKPGQGIELRAEMDLVVGLTACSAEKSNNYAFKPIDYEVS
jgi:uncharacterized protein YcgI (DUF1989 family)